MLQGHGPKGRGPSSLHWSRGQGLRKNRASLLPPTPTPTGPRLPSHVPGDSSAQRPTHQRPRRSSRARESHRPQPWALLPACLLSPHSPLPRNSTKWLELGRFRGTTGVTLPALQQPSHRLDSPMAMRALQSFLWKSDQALVLQYLLQVRIP